MSISYVIDSAMSRDIAELLVDLLEDNFKKGWHEHLAGMGADYAVEIRKAFGMGPQPKMTFKQDA